MDCSTPGFPVHHQLMELTQTRGHLDGDDIQLSHPLSSSSLPAFSLSQHQGVFQWVCCSSRVAKDYSFSFSISPSSEYSGLVSFRIDWLDLLAVQGTLTSLLPHHSSKASILQHSAFFVVQLSHPYMINGKTIALTRWNFVGTVMSLLFNMLSGLLIAILPRSKRLLTLWLQLLSAVILKLKEIKSALLPFFPHLCLAVMGLDAMIFIFWMLSFKPAFLTLLFHLHQGAL